MDSPGPWNWLPWRVFIYSKFGVFGAGEVPRNHDFAGEKASASHPNGAFGWWNSPPIFFAHGSKLNCAWSLWLPSWKSSWNQQATFRHLSILTFVVYIHIIFGLIPSFDVLCPPSSQNLCWKSCWNQFHHFYWRLPWKITSSYGSCLIANC